MDDVNINKICLDIEEVELEGEENEWIKLSWINNQSDVDEYPQSLEIYKDLDNEMIQAKECDNKMVSTNTEIEDISDGISVITESDVDIVNTNSFQICHFNLLKSSQMLEEQIRKKKDIWNLFLAGVFGMIIGLVSNHLFAISEVYPVSNIVDTENLRVASHNIANTCKELTDVKTMLNEIKGQIPPDEKIKQFLTEFSGVIESSNKTSRKPIMITKDFLDSKLHPLDQLHESLYVLSALTFIYDANSFWRNEINKTLDIVNSTKVFYNTLFVNDTQDAVNSTILNLLQQNNDKIHTTSKLLLFNVAEKVNKITSKVYNTYVKERHKLYKKLCHLKNKFPNDQFLKHLTENNEFFKNYNQSCFSNYTSKHSDDMKIMKQNIKMTKADKIHSKYDKKNNRKVENNNKEDFWKNKRNKDQNLDKSILKFLRNSSHKIYNISELLFSKVVEKVNKLNKKLHHLKGILPNDNEFLKLLLKDDEDNKESTKSDEIKEEYFQNNIISKNNFNNILTQNTCSLSSNYCSKFDININTLDTGSNHKIKNYKHKKYTNNKKIIRHENTTKILPIEGENKPKKNDNFKSNGSIKKVTDNKVNYEEKNISSQNEIKNYKSKYNINYPKSKYSSFDSRSVKQDNQHYININKDRKDKRSYPYRKQQWLDDSDWYFQRARSRRIARRHAEYIYPQGARWSWEKYQF